VILIAELSDLDLQSIGPPMLATESHQIRTPLAGCATNERGALDILGRGLDDALKRIFRPRASGSTSTIGIGVTSAAGLRSMYPRGIPNAIGVRSIFTN
jgi:hypothetical protein